MSNPIVRQCRYCKQPLAHHIPASREYCGDITCRAAWQKDLIAIQDKKRQEEESACRTEIRKIALKQASEGGFDPDELAVTVVPYNPHNASSVSRVARKKMETHLQHLLDTIEQCNHEETFTPEQKAPPATHLDDLLVACCTTCRGNCCLQGKDTSAYLQRATLKRVMEAKRLTEEQVLKLYLSQIPEQSMEKGCLYQAENGCHLDDDLRADICREYFCRSMITMMESYPRTMPERNMIVAEDTNQVMAVKLMDDTFSKDIACNTKLKF